MATVQGAELGVQVYILVRAVGAPKIDSLVPLPARQYTAPSSCDRVHLRLISMLVDV
jgi:hypothetical protein